MIHFAPRVASRPPAATTGHAVFAPRRRRGRLAVPVVLGVVLIAAAARALAMSEAGPGSPDSAVHALVAAADEPAAEVEAQLFVLRKDQIDDAGGRDGARARPVLAFGPTHVALLKSPMIAGQAIELLKKQGLNKMKTFTGQTEIQSRWSLQGSR